MRTKDVRIALVEVHAVDLELDGQPLDEDFSLNHPKYPQLVLAANLRRSVADRDFDLEVDVVDLKADGTPERVQYRRIDYCGSPIDAYWVGMPFEAAADRLLNADFVGITADFSLERSMVIEVIKFLRKSSTKPPLIAVGGHDATADPEYYLHRGADFCFLGEGEVAIQEIARAIAHDESPAVPGSVFLHDGQLEGKAKRRKAPLYEDIVFPDLDLLTASSYDEYAEGGVFPTGVAPRLMSFETSRGCGEACSFCDSSFIVGRYRPIPFDRLQNQLAAFKTAGIKSIQFIDDNLLYRILPQFGGDVGRQTLLELFDLMYEEGFNWSFTNGLQIGLFEKNNVIDVELINAIYRNRFRDGAFIGCWRAYLPMEKFTADEMARFKKLKPLEIERTILTAIAELGVPCLMMGFIIAGLTDTHESIAETAIRAAEFRDLIITSSKGKTLPIVNPFVHQPIPGTPDFRTFQKHVVFPIDQYPELYNIYTSVLQTEQFSPLDFTNHQRRLRSELNSHIPHDLVTSQARVR